MIRSKDLRFCLIAILLTIGLGLALRRYGYTVGLPVPIVKYGGSMLWGTMPYFVVAAALFKFPDRFSIALALVIAVLVELFRLYHMSWLDAYRVTTAGSAAAGPGLFGLEYCGLCLRHLLCLSGKESSHSLITLHARFAPSLPRRYLSLSTIS